MEWREELRKRAKRALTRPSPYGPDVDLGAFEWKGHDEEGEGRLSELPTPILERAKVMGIDVEERKVSGTYLQVDLSVLRTHVIKKFEEQGVIVTSIEEALKRFGWVKEYYWKAVPVDLDKYTAVTELHGSHGYFIYVPPGIKVKDPIQACLFIHRKGTTQAVHNIIVVDEGAELNLLTACSTLPVKSLHIGVSEFYVKRNAKLTFTMVHYWAPTTYVRPRAVAIVEEGGVFVNYYVHLAPVRSLQMFPTAHLIGPDSQAYLTSILLATRGAHLDVGGRITFKGPGSRGEVISRSVVKDEAYAVLRGELIGENVSKGHLDCKGLLLSPKAKGEAIPVLKSSTELAELTHEAALGRISREELEYLLSKGFTEDEATSLIVRGFLEVGVERLPPALRSYVINVLDAAARYAKG